MIELRDYQSDLVERIRESFRTNRRVLAVAPTGSGKTVVFAYITSNAAAKGKRVIVLAHRAEIVEQISGALDRMGVRHGRIQPGHRMTDDPVSVAMVQTLARRIDQIPAPALLVIDEAHHGIAGTWQTVTSAYLSSRILGVTATPRRLDGKGLGDAFDDMIVGPSMSDLIAQGHLAKYRYLAPPKQIDLSAVKKTMGDYAIDELAAIMDKNVITGDAIGHYKQHLDGRPAIVFAVTVAHAERVAEQFNAAGIRAASVDGKMDRSERRDRIDGIGNGKYQILTSCELISEGVDVPIVAGAILLRPTQSLGMYLQQVGRALRPKPDGSDCVILDHVGNVERFGLPDVPRLWSLDTKKKKDEAEPVHTCERCFRVFAGGPGWREKSECGDGDKPEGCILNATEGAGRSSPQQVDGELVDVTAATPRAPASWAGGIDMIAAKGEQWKLLLRAADTREKLSEIARARGFKRGWVDHIMRERDAWKRQREEVAFKPVAAPAPQHRNRPADPLDEIISA